MFSKVLLVTCSDSKPFSWMCIDELICTGTGQQNLEAGLDLGFGFRGADCDRSDRLSQLILLKIKWVLQH